MAPWVVELSLMASTQANPTPLRGKAQLSKGTRTDLPGTGVGNHHQRRAKLQTPSSRDT